MIDHVALAHYHALVGTIRADLVHYREVWSRIMTTEASSRKIAEPEAVIAEIILNDHTVLNTHNNHLGPFL